MPSSSTILMRSLASEKRCPSAGVALMRFSIAPMLPGGADAACSRPPNARAGDPVVEAAPLLARREQLPCPTHPWVRDYKGERARIVAFGSGGDILFDDPGYPERIRSEVMTRTLRVAI